MLAMRSKLLEALKAAEAGDFAKADSLVDEAGSCIAEAHHAQTSLLTKEAGEDLAYSVTMMHGQDHDDDYLVKRFDAPFNRTL